MIPAKKDYNQRLKGAKILVVEDTEDHWLLIKRAMEASSTKVEPVWAANAQQAMSYLKDCLTMGLRAPFLILLDLYLPEKEQGWQLLKQIRALSAPIGHLPIVMFSSSDRVEDIAEAYDRGVSSYLVKPDEFKDWITSFQLLQEYWIEVVSLPSMRY